MSTLTVAELITKLQQLDPNAIVLAGGDDTVIFQPICDVEETYAIMGNNKGYVEESLEDAQEHLSNLTDNDEDAKIVKVVNFVHNMFEPYKEYHDVLED